MPGAAELPSLTSPAEPVEAPSPEVVPSDSDKPSSPADEAPPSSPAVSASVDEQTPSQPSGANAATTGIFGLIPGDQLVLAVLLFVVLGLMGWHWAQMSGWGSEPIEIERLEPMPLNYKIDINSATWVELSQLDGIGETLAERIVADREANGPFKSVDDLRRVDGIGPKTVAKLRKYIVARPPE